MQKYQICKIYFTFSYFCTIKICFVEKSLHSEIYNFFIFLFCSTIPVWELFFFCRISYSFYWYNWGEHIIYCLIFINFLGGLEYKKMATILTLFLVCVFFFYTMCRVIYMISYLYSVSCYDYDSIKCVFFGGEQFFVVFNNF